MAGRNTESRPDRILLEGMVFFGRHGTRQEEQALGQHFEVDLEIEADLAAARASDRIQDTIDYGAVYAIVKEVVEGTPYKLLERLAEEIASRVMERFNPLAVRVRIAKPRLPLGGGVLKAAAVETWKTRDDNLPHSPGPRQKLP